MVKQFQWYVLEFDFKYKGFAPGDMPQFLRQ